MFKKLGLRSEQVCEFGKWKNVCAFTSHYLRLGANEMAGQRIDEMVHNVSPLGNADPDLTRTTGNFDLGGSVREGDAQDNGEPILSPYENIFGNDSDLRHLHSEDGPQVNMQRPRWPNNVSSCADSCQQRIDFEDQQFMENSSSRSSNAELQDNTFQISNLDSHLASSSSSLPSHSHFPPKRERQRGDSPPTKFVFKARKFPKPP